MSFEYAITYAITTSGPVQKPDTRDWRFRDMKIYETSRSVPLPVPNSYAATGMEMANNSIVVMWELYKEDEAK